MPRNRPTASPAPIPLGSCSEGVAVAGVRHHHILPTPFNTIRAREAFTLDDGFGRCADLVRTSSRSVSGRRRRRRSSPRVPRTRLAPRLFADILAAEVATLRSQLRRADDLPVGVEQLDVRLIDDIGPDANPNLDFVLTDTVRLIEQLRNEGRTVLLHCVAAQSGTPTVAALYGARKQGISGGPPCGKSTSVLPDACPNSDFRSALKRLTP